MEQQLEGEQHPVSPDIIPSSLAESRRGSSSVVLELVEFTYKSRVSTFRLDLQRHTGLRLEQKLRKHFQISESAAIVLVTPSGGRLRLLPDLPLLPQFPQLPSLPVSSTPFSPPEAKAAASLKFKVKAEPAAATSSSLSLTSSDHHHHSSLTPVEEDVRQESWYAKISEVQALVGSILAKADAGRSVEGEDENVPTWAEHESGGRGAEEEEEENEDQQNNNNSTSPAAADVLPPEQSVSTATVPVEASSLEANPAPPAEQLA